MSSLIQSTGEAAGEVMQKSYPLYMLNEIDDLSAFVRKALLRYINDWGGNRDRLLYPRCLHGSRSNLYHCFRNYFGLVAQLPRKNDLHSLKMKVNNRMVICAEKPMGNCANPF